MFEFISVFCGGCDLCCFGDSLGALASLAGALLGLSLATAGLAVLVLDSAFRLFRGGAFFSGAVEEDLLRQRSSWS